MDMQKMRPPELAHDALLQMRSALVSN